MRHTNTTLLAILSLFTTLAHAQSNKVTIDKIVAIVGDRIILQSDISNSIADAKRNEQLVPEDANCRLLEQALVSKALMIQAEKDSMIITDEEVEAELDQKIRWFIRKFGSREALESYAGKTIYQIKDDSREAVRENKMIIAMQQRIVGNVKLTPGEVEAFFNKIPAADLPFFESQLEVGQIVIYPRYSRDMERYIVAELNQYKRQIELKSATFEQLVRYSEDMESRQRGGKYDISRNDNSFDPVFLSAAFRLKPGEISIPVKTKFGYHLIQMLEKNGDDAIVRHILRVPAVTDIEINQAVARLDTVRSKIVAGTISFNEAARKYSNDESARFGGPWVLNEDGSTSIDIGGLDKEIITGISTLAVGQISQPLSFIDKQGNKGVRIIYLKSRSNPHVMNIRDDYSRISQMALEEKRNEALNKWIKTKLPTYYIMIDSESSSECKQLAKYGSTDQKGF